MFSSVYGTYFPFKCTLNCRLQFVSILSSSNDLNPHLAFFNQAEEAASNH